MYLVVLQAHAFPNWALQVPADDSNWFYTVGAGSDITEAKKNALGDLATRISVSIQSTSQQFVDAQQQGTEFYLELDTKQSSSTVQFNRVEVLRKDFEESTQTHYILARVDKDSFFDARLQALTQTLSSLDFDASTPLPQSLEKLLKFNWQKQQLAAQLYLLQAYEQPITLQQAKFEQLNQSFNTLASQINIELYSPSTKLQSLLTAWLQKAGFSFSRKEQQPVLSLAASDINTWSGQDQFHYAVKQQTQLVFAFANNVIVERTLVTQAYSTELTQAEAAAWQKLRKQVQTN